ncbi:unnamed protein product [Timema podura]|uniref:116kDa U5 small nuclear ribonucleoprotein component N-terminal domain-containing protein n=2 Tax=Timema TaxID=61471 RepID=A0ABN7NZL6_TIMPD|nr:unnamed protein product [Timema podura]
MRNMAKTTNFYYEQFGVVKSVVDMIAPECATSVCKYHNSVIDPKVACSNAYTRSIFGWLPEIIKRLESSGFPLQEFMDIIESTISYLKMDADLYDEFGNYIGPELESEDEEEESFSERQPDTQEYDVSSHFLFVICIGHPLQ